MRKLLFYAVLALTFLLGLALPIDRSTSLLFITIGCIGFGLGIVWLNWRRR